MALFFSNQIVEHVKLGAVTIIGPEIDKPGTWRVAVFTEWQHTPLTVTRTKRYGHHVVDFPVTVHVVKAETLRRRPRHEADVDAFMRSHRTPRWKPKPLPKSRRLPKLTDEKFAALMLECGAVQVSA